MWARSGGNSEGALQSFLALTRKVKRGENRDHATSSRPVSLARLVAKYYHKHSLDRGFDSDTGKLSRTHLDSSG